MTAAEVSVLRIAAAVAEADNSATISATRLKAPLAMRAVVDGHAATRVNGLDVAVMIEIGFGPPMRLKTGFFARRAIDGSVASGVGDALAAARAIHNDGWFVFPHGFGFGCWGSAIRSGARGDAGSHSS